MTDQIIGATETSVPVSGHDRHRRAWLAAIIGNLGRLISLLSVTITVPLFLDYLGAERYGVWASVRGLGGYFQTMSLGVGYGLVFAVAQAIGTGNRRAVGEKVSSAFFPMTVLVIAIVSALTVVAFIAPIGRLFGIVSPKGLSETRHLLVILAWAIGTGTILAIVLAVRTGYQEEYVTNVWALVGAVLGFGGAVLAAVVGWRIEVLGAIVFFATPVAMLPNFVQFMIANPEAVPRPSLFRWDEFRGLLGQGLALTGAQVIGAVLWSTDNIVIASTLGAGAVVPYSIVFSPIFAAFSAIHMITTSYGAAIREAYAAGDWTWLSATHRRLTGLVLALGGLGAILVFFWGRDAISLWVGRDLAQEVPDSLFMILGAYLPVLLWNSVWGFPLTAIGRFHWALLLASFEAGVNLGLSLWLVKSWGISGVAIGTLAPAVLLTSWGTPLLLLRATGGRLRPDVSQIVRQAFVPTGIGALASAILHFVLLDATVPARLAAGAVPTVLIFVVVAACSFGIRLSDTRHPSALLRRLVA